MTTYKDRDAKLGPYLFERPYAEKFFAACEYAGTVTNPYNVRNEESTRHTGLYVCRQPRRPWSEMWPEMQWYQ